ncbi:MAG: HIT family protein, partial [Rubrobacteraceae bacterium]
MSGTDCVFCQIVSGDLNAEVVHNEEEVLAFRDINGRAPVHVLVIPKRHVANLEGIG